MNAVNRGLSAGPQPHPQPQKKAQRNTIVLKPKLLHIEEPKQTDSEKKFDFKTSKFNMLTADKTPENLDHSNKKMTARKDRLIEDLK